MRPMSFGQGGPSWGSGGSGSQPPQWGGQSPDWAALAEASETRNRRRRWLLIGGGALATVAVGTAVAMAVVSADGNEQASNRPASELPTSAAIPSDTTGTGPSFEETSAPPPLDPKDFIGNVKKDTAPLAPDLLFPGTQLTMGETVYKKGAMASTKNCASAAQGTLGPVLTKNDCTRFMRVTYEKDGIAVTVGVAVFDAEGQALKAKNDADAKSVVQSLSGEGVPTFCRSAICRSTTNSYGRYTYFTVAGFTNGKDVTQKDSKVFTTGDDLAEFTFRQIHRRGESQASAAANQ
ncbi:hypothetical protein OG418_21395 [Streptomyces phaeochromogenes]|uniref:Tat pathway signal sequence domain protein n=2 Tax=Streptomyces phaeochromogenes TaxID=1923 RepID=A0ABZ1HJ81_STRPH|nr:hypothetical protein [Streptomyces phaeochromogenes]MCX5604253.1 hypothetical protein [Streptomyces phaeochromogenes]WRZ31798.1 hypothetical protein OG931_30680 [Streptomyces phaeochromogenes]WSD17331.1 hypothetical protein OHB35_31110 [Streptomyces phaeochromogenes]WSJ05868.1 hypothetical protein OG437_20540 [Streptomyces phaeochromogenes]